MLKGKKLILVAVVLAVAVIGLAMSALMMTAPIMTYPISVDLPQRVINPSQQQSEPRPIDLRVDASNRIYWKESPVDANELQQKMEDEVRKDPTNMPELRIDADPASDYEVMAKILAQAKNAQIKKIAFVR
jgi:biopolymer transport protein ExbD